MKHSIILDDEASAKLQEIASRDHRTFSNLVAKWITERLIQEEQQERERPDRAHGED